MEEGGGAGGGRRRVEPPARPLPRGRRAARRGGRGDGGRTERAPARPAPLQLQLRLRPGLDPLSSRSAPARTCRVSGIRVRCHRGHHRSHIRRHHGAEPPGFVCVPAAATPGAPLSDSADCAARRGRRSAGSTGRTGPARSAPGVKLRSSLGSGENLLKPGVAQGRGGGAEERRTEPVPGS